LTDPDVNYTAWLRFLNILEFTDCLLALNKPKDALDKLIFAEEIDPEKDEDITKKIHWKKAKCHMLLKQHECALKEYLISEIVLLSAAKSSVIPDNLARFYIEFGRCCQAVSKDENSAVLCINNAMIIGHFEKALVYCEKLRKEIVGVRLEKEEYTIHTVLLYDIFVKQKDYSTALAYLETFTKCYAHQTQHHWTTTVNTLTLSSEDQALLFSKMAFCQRKLHRIGTAIQSYKSSISYYKVIKKMSFGS
jgi:tetratricopeptide (TPR) repeat protein